MSRRQHHYRVEVEWAGNRGEGTAAYKGYARDHLIRAEGKHDIEGSSDANFNGDPARWNPEELLLASLSACHKLWYLSLAAMNGVVVTAYVDDAQAWMEEAPDGGGQFTRASLAPKVTVEPGSDLAAARSLHHKAHEMCFIARSVKFPVECEPEIVVQEDRSAARRQG